MAFRIGSNPLQRDFKAGWWVLSIVWWMRGEGPSGPYAKAMVEGVSPSVRGAKLFELFSFSDAALFRLDGLCQAVGLEDGVEFEPERDTDLCGLAGRPFIGNVVENRDQEGKVQYKIQSFRPWRDRDPLESHLEGFTAHKDTGTMRQPRDRNGGGYGGGGGGYHPRPQPQARSQERYDEGAPAPHPDHDDYYDDDPGPGYDDHIGDTRERVYDVEDPTGPDDHTDGEPSPI